MSDLFQQGDYRFLLPNVKRQPIGSQGEMATFIPYRLEKGLTAEDIRREVARQPHLAALSRALDPKRRVYLLDAPSSEVLELACEYIGTFHRLTWSELREHVNISNDTDGVTDADDHWTAGDPNLRLFDFSNAFPYLGVNDIQQLYQGNNQISWRGRHYSEERRPDRCPWWALSRTSPIAVRCCGMVNELPSLVEAMEDRSLIIIAHSPTMSIPLAPSGPAGPGSDEPPEHIVRFTDRIRRHMEGIGFELETELIQLGSPEHTGSYKQQILCQLARDKHAPLAKSANLVRILSQIHQARRGCSNAAIAKAVSNAILRRDHTGPLTNGDFSYLTSVFHSARTADGTAAPRGTEPTLIGQEEVKRQLDSVLDAMSFQAKRKELGLSADPIHYTFAFLGAPGTGKTTWALRLAREMQKRHLLENTDSICISAAELKAKYVGHTTGKVKALFDQYGVIILDEAYSLTEDGHSDTYTREALAQLCVELENHGTDRLVILAGYGGQANPEDDRMLRFLQSNPGINSRVSFKVHFQNFRPEELVEVTRTMLSHQGYSLPESADPAIADYFRSRVQERSFGNCREARNLCDRIKVQMSRRLANIPDLTPETANRVEQVDVTAALEALAGEYAGLNRSAGRTIGFVGRP